MHPELLEPVRWLPGETKKTPESGTALCLSGGGYRAMLFHTGVLWRLNEAGLLAQLDQVSSVSGGSITAAALAIAWPQLTFDSAGCASGFKELVAQPLLRLAEECIDERSVVMGGVSPFDTIADHVAREYRKHLMGNVALADLPAKPSFVFNATNLETGDLFRFTKSYIADWRLGQADPGSIDLATAVACSSAFPPVLSPFKLGLRDATWESPDGGNADSDPDELPLTDPGYRREITLSDGGVYDNLGLETAWKSHFNVFVSDAGGQMAPDPDPPADWARQMLRVLKVIDNQVRSLRKLQVIGSLESGARKGLYIGIRSDPASYQIPDVIPVDPAVRKALAKLSTRLAPPGGDNAERLINWGYALCDTGVRAHVHQQEAKGSLPYPDVPLA
jgi:NTE family protein